MLDRLSNDTTVSILYDEYIDRPKLPEQKKNIWVYSSSPPPAPSRGVGTISNFSAMISKIINDANLSRARPELSRSVFVITLFCQNLWLRPCKAKI